MHTVRRHIEVRGVVQGVGFRPFIFTLAARYNVVGFVQNSVTGVIIEAESSIESLKRFVAAITSEPPPLARIAEVTVTDIPVTGVDQSFRIQKSDTTITDAPPLFSPDNHVCDACVAELFDTTDRRFRYPFINCTDCGPRYTIITGAPYDRSKTSMASFPMCAACRVEYENPLDRRFHAQPVACPQCGPQVCLLDAQGTVLDVDDPITQTVALLAEGKIIAIKGLGGYHIGCDAAAGNTVERLRIQKRRMAKPFAVMVREVNAARRYAILSALDEKLLTSRERPIVLAPINTNAPLAKGIAPGLKEVGLLLPYTPIHLLLFADSRCPDALVMTSGNYSDEPILFDDDEAMDRLGPIVDGFLIHNRAIVWRCDDSVVRSVNGTPMLLRRSRGWVPAPLFLRKDTPPILATGGDVKSVFLLAKGNTAFPGPHIGDLEHAAALRSYRLSIDHYKKIFGIQPEHVVVDAHPGYHSSNYGRSLGIPVTEVFHHHAHIASVMAEKRIDEPVIGVALDGSGYGEDGTIWGGEIFIVDEQLAFTRRFHFPTLVLPGGERAIKQPWRVAIGLLYECFGESYATAHPSFANAIGHRNLALVKMMIDTNLNTPMTTSAGRLFDGVAALLNVIHENRYEGEAPMTLEAIADASVSSRFDFQWVDGTLHFPAMVESLISMSATAEKRSIASALFHNTVAAAIVDAVSIIQSETGISDVVLGGGVFQNRLLVEKITARLNRSKTHLHLPRSLPINDGGIALGQLAIAFSRMN